MVDAPELLAAHTRKVRMGTCVGNSEELVVRMHGEYFYPGAYYSGSGTATNMNAILARVPVREYGMLSESAERAAQVVCRHYPTDYIEGFVLTPTECIPTAWAAIGMQVLFPNSALAPAAIRGRICAGRLRRELPRGVHLCGIRIPRELQVELRGRFLSRYDHLFGAPLVRAAIL